MDKLLTDTTSARPYINKERVRESLLGIEALAHTLQKFVKYGTDEFYTEVECGSNEPSDDEDDIDRMDFIDLCIKREIRDTDIFNFEIIPYLHKQPKTYIEFFNSELIADAAELLRDVFAQADLEKMIFRYEDVDMMHDAYLVLKATSGIFNNVDELLDNNDLLNSILDYNLSYIAYEDENEDSETSIRTAPNAFEWLGAPSELAYLMQQLAYKGYINNPVRKDGEFNNAAFHKQIIQHFMLTNGKESSVLTNLKDPCLSADNPFGKAVDKLPQKRLK